MTRQLRVAWLSALVVFTLVMESGCGGRDREQGRITATRAALGGQVVARVGQVDLPASLVGAVARARHVAPSTALSWLVDDALASSGAMARGLDRSPEVNFERTAALARVTLAKVKEAAHETPPTDDEVRLLSQDHWMLVDSCGGIGDDDVGRV